MTVYRFDLRVYSLAAIKKAAYRLSGTCKADIHLVEPDLAEVQLTKLAGSVSESSIDEFPNLVLDEDLREKIAAESEQVRNVILAQAFSGLSLTDPTGETADFREDPKGILKSQ